MEMGKTMAELFIEKLGKEIAEKALDEYKYKGKTIREWADLLSNGDIVEVVRCKDCKYYRSGKHFTDINFCQKLPYYAEKGGLNTTDDDFCSLGERKEK